MFKLYLNKSIFLFLQLMLIVLVFSSCSTKAQKEKQKRSVKISKKKITYTASPVENGITKLTLKAIGNSMMEMAFEPNILVVKANTEVHLTLINAGKDETMLHNVLIVEKGTVEEIGIKAIKAKDYVPKHSGVIVASQVVQPQRKTTLIFDAPEIGEYAFVCTYPGHYLKMRGRFVVIQ